MDELRRRFECPSDSLPMTSLVVGARKDVLRALGLGVAMHLALTQVGGAETERTAAKPLTTQFIKRQPRLAKPLELKKRPQPRRRQMQREMVAAKAEMHRDQRSTRFQPTGTLRGLARPSVEIGRMAGFGSVEVEPRSIAGIIGGTKEGEQKIDMCLELLDVETLDTGKYHAMVIQDPTDRRNIQGYLHIAAVLPASHAAEHMAWINWSVIPSLAELSDAMNQYTNIRTDLMGRISLGSAETLRTPWIYFLAYKSYELTPAEYETVGAYVTLGGFLFADEAIRVGDASYISVPKAHRRMFALGFEAQGLVESRHWQTAKIPSDHPLFHCYFDFDGSPIGYTFEGIEAYPVYLEDPMVGVFLQETLVGIISHRSYYAPWCGKADMKRAGQRQRALQFGINTIIYALTREGSITNRLMNTISY